MELKIRKSDLVWGYFAQFFSIASGLLILPLVLKLLSPAEIGFNYLMLTIGSFVTLFDFGFAPQFGRNITYIFSGSQMLLKEGIDVSGKELGINYRLLAAMILTAKYFYKRLSMFVLIMLLGGGSFYIYVITDGFTSVENSIAVWLLYCVSVYFNMYYGYYSSLLNGKGMIKENRKALVYSKLVYTLFSLILLLLNFGLLSIVIANLISPFVVRYLSYRYFFTEDLNQKISLYSIKKTEIIDLLSIIWHNAKKLGLVYLGSFAITRAGLFIAGLYLSLEKVGSYGLMVQLVGLIAIVSGTLSTLYQPRLASLRTKEKQFQLIIDFSYTLFVFILLFALGSIVIIFCGDWALHKIGSTTALPERTILIVYLAVVFLEINHSLFSSLIVTNNEIPFVTPTILAGALIIVFSLLILQFTNLEIMGLVLVPGIVQLLYNNWKWPYEISKVFRVSFLQMVIIGGRHFVKNLRSFFLNHSSSIQ